MWGRVFTQPVCPFGRVRNCVFRKMEPRALIEEIQVDGAAQCVCRGKRPVHCESIVMRPFNTFGTIYGQFECLFGRPTPPCLIGCSLCS